VFGPRLRDPHFFPLDGFFFILHRNLFSHGTFTTNETWRRFPFRNSRNVSTINCPNKRTSLSKKSLVSRLRRQRVHIPVLPWCELERCGPFLLFLDAWWRFLVRSLRSDTMTSYFPYQYLLCIVYALPRKKLGSKTRRIERNRTAAACRYQTNSRHATAQSSNPILNTATLIEKEEKD
jgi:hypothetical protein